MPIRRETLSNRQNFTKRRSFAEGQALVDAAHVATQRLYCDALSFWRRCVQRSCQRHRRCLGAPQSCLLRGLPFVPQAERLKARKQVIAGGRRRIRPATHMEWFVRREELRNIVMWNFG